MATVAERVAFGKGTACRHQGAATGRYVKCGTCRGGESLLAVHRCELLGGECIKNPPRDAADDGLRVCGRCDKLDIPGVAAAVPAQPLPPATPGRLVLNIERNGIGDGILALCAAEGFRAENPGVAVDLRVGRHAAPWVRLFDGWAGTGVNLVSPGESMRTIPHGKDGKSRAASFASAFGAKAPRLPVLGRRRSHEQLGKAFAGAVLVSPFCDHASREWPVDAWVEVVSRLRGAGLRVVVVDKQFRTQGGNTRIKAFDGVETLVGASPAKVVQAMLNARCVVGNDSGMLHVAGVLGVPGVAVCGPTFGKGVFGFYESVRFVQGVKWSFEGVTVEGVVEEIMQCPE